MARVLVVEDSSFMRKRIAKALTDAGHDVVGQARDGEEGYKLYRKIRPDVVVTDVTMRGVDGIAGARMIRDYDPEALVIFMSLVNDPAVRSEAARIGAEGFLAKDQHDRLIELIGNCCRKAR